VAHMVLPWCGYRRASTGHHMFVEPVNTKYHPERTKRYVCIHGSCLWQAETTLERAWWIVKMPASRSMGSNRDAYTNAALALSARPPMVLDATEGDTPQAMRVVACSRGMSCRTCSPARCPSAAFSPGLWTMLTQCDERASLSGRIAICDWSCHEKCLRWCRLPVRGVKRSVGCHAVDEAGDTTTGPSRNLIRRGHYPSNTRRGDAAHLPAIVHQ
jgi:hypothetical protein